MKPISDEKRAEILLKLAEGKSCRSIAHSCHVSHGTVSNLRPLVPSPPPCNHGGRPSKLTSHDRCRIARLVTSAKADNAIQVKRLSGLDVHPQTIRNALKKEGMVSAGKVKKPLLRKKHRKARMGFCYRNKDYTPDDWKRHLFSDETKINRLGSDGKVWVWKKKGAALADQHCIPTVKGGGGSVMVWGSFSSQGVGDIHLVQGNMDGDQFTRILDHRLFSSARRCGLRRGDFVFQQDNDPKHTSGLAQEWLEDHNVETMVWPAQSPDLNPIETLWALIKRRLNNYERAPTSIHDLWKRVEMEWYKITPEECRKQVETMPRRIRDCLKAKGGPTKW
jgi:transposase